MDPTNEYHDCLSKMVRGLKTIGESWPVQYLTCKEAINYTEWLWQTYLRLSYIAPAYLYETQALTGWYTEHNSPWFWISEVSYGRILGSILGELKQNLGVDFTAVKEQLEVMEVGEKLELQTLPKNAFGRLFVILRSDYVGGEFVVSQGDATETLSFSKFSTDCNWLAVFGDSLKDTQPILSGEMMLVSFTLFMTRDFQDIKIQVPIHTPVHTPKRLGKRHLLHTGPSHDGLKQKYIHKFAGQVQEKFALKLDDSYSDTKCTLDSLRGTDRLLIDHLKPLGFSFDLEPVIIGFQQECVWAFRYREASKHSKMVLLYALEKFNPERIKEEPIDHYVSLSLVIEPPTWWTYVRLLWIAWMKHSEVECPIAVLPREMMHYVITMYMEWYRENKRLRERELSRKRKVH